MHALKPDAPVLPLHSRSFTCTTFWPEYLIAGVAQECGGEYNTSVGLCLDGMNANGLAVASLGVFQPVDASYSEGGIAHGLHLEEDVCVHQWLYCLAPRACTCAGQWGALLVDCTPRSSWVTPPKSAMRRLPKRHGCIQQPPCPVILR